MKNKEEKEEYKVDSTEEKGRVEFTFFFPSERRTIKATSIEEAKKKLKEEQKNE